MINIKSREEFLSESFENDIRFGDSWLGRIVRRVRRLASLGHQYLSINGLTDSLKYELDCLIAESVGPEVKNEVKEIIFKHLLEDINNVVESDDGVPAKREILLGTDKKTGVIDFTIAEINKIDDKSLPDKEKVLNKLELFKKKLEELLKNEPENEEDTETEPDVVDEPKKDIKQLGNVKTEPDVEKEPDVDLGYAQVVDEPKKDIKQLGMGVADTNTKTEPDAAVDTKKNIKQLGNKEPVVDLGYAQVVDEPKKDIKQLGMGGTDTNMKTTNKPKPPKKGLTKNPKTLIKDYKKLPKKDKTEANLKPPYGAPDNEDDKVSANESYFQIYKLLEQELKQDRIQIIWKSIFSKQDIENYKIVKGELDKLVDKTEKINNQEHQVPVDLVQDNILRIVDLFGKAYKLYAYDQIPSGRTNGKITLATFNMYEYIGSGKPPEWSEDKNPGYGPWASKITLNKWDDGVMGILRDTKYRKALANVTFVAKGPNQEPGSGLTLFSFINDMLNRSSLDSDFKAKRHRLLKKYFNLGEEPEIDTKKTDKPENNKEEQKDTEYKHVFLNYNDQKIKRQFILEKFKDDKSGYLREFIKIDFLGSKESLICFLYGYEQFDKKDWLFIKFHKCENNKLKIKESMITKYLGLEDKYLPDDFVYSQDETVFLTVVELIDFTRMMSQGLKFKYTNVMNFDKNNMNETDINSTAHFEVMKIGKVDKVEYLTYSVGSKIVVRKQKTVKNYVVKEHHSPLGKTAILAKTYDPINKKIKFQL